MLWPAGDPPEHEDPNLFATVILASYGSVDVLLTADAESPVTLPLNPPPVEILKVAHHGSADDGLPRLLALTRPEVAVISCGGTTTTGTRRPPHWPRWTRLPVSTSSAPIARAAS